MTDIVLKILLFLSPIAYSLKMPLNLFDIAFFRFGIIALFIVSLFDNKKREIVVIKRPIAFLLMFGLFHLFLFNFHSGVASAYINLFLACMAIIIIAEYCSGYEQIKKYIVYASAINVIVWLAQQAGYSPIFNTLTKNWSGGLIGNVAVLFTYLAVILPFVFEFSIPVFCLYILLSIISGQYILLGVALLLLLYKMKLKIIPLAIGIVALIACHKHIMSSITMRWNYAWKPTLDAIAQRPLLGFGLGFYPSNFPGDNACNSFLQLIFGMGVGIIAWIVYAFRKVKDLFDYSLFSIALISLILIASVEYVLEIPRLWITIIFVISCFIIKQKEVHNVGSLFRPQ